MQNRFAHGRRAKSVALMALVALSGAAALALPAHAQDGQDSVNTGTTNNTALNPGTPGTGGRVVARLLSAPRLDPSVTFNLNDADAVPLAVHLRDHELDAGGMDLGDYREGILLFSAGPDGGGGVAHQFYEGLIFDDELGIIDEEATTRPTDGFGEVMDGFHFGGSAYESSRLFGRQSGLLADPYMSDPLSFKGELNTFGGLAINGGKIAFFAGIVQDEKEFQFDENGEIMLDENGDPVLAETDRSEAPDKEMESELLDPDPDTGDPRPMKPAPFSRGIWATNPQPGSPFFLTRLALEQTSSPPDPDPDRSFQPGGEGLDFRRVHPSDYGPAGFNLIDPIEGSWFGEQRFSRVSNIAMNQAGRVAFRGDIGEDDPILGIWAEGPDGAGGTALWRVFVEDPVMIDGEDDDGGGGGGGDEEEAPPTDDNTLDDDGDPPLSPIEENRNPWIAFENTVSLDPADFYSIVSLGAPAISDAPEPLVTAYALLRGGDDSGSGAITPREEMVVAIIARRPGVAVVDELGMPLDGFPPQILAIEGEPFSQSGQNTVFELRASPSRARGLPGLADLPGEANTTRQYFKDTRPAVTSTTSLSAFHPRPAINADNAVVYMGTIAKIIEEGVEMPPEADPLTEPLDSDPEHGPLNNNEEDALLLDEAIWSTRGVGPTGEPELIVQEGDHAPVVVDGVPVPNARFTAYAPNPFETSVGVASLQAFSRPVINDKGEVVFIGTWFSDGNGDITTTEDWQFGRGIFLSRAPGHLQCLVSSGDLTEETFDVPGSADDVRGVLTDDICRVATPIADPNSAGTRAFEQVGWTDSGLLSFTTRMERETTGSPLDGDDLGWGLFMMNTAAPSASHRKPQLIVKTTTPSDNLDFFEIPGLPHNVVLDGEPRYHTGVSAAFGESAGGDTNLHPMGLLAFGVNPDAGDALGTIVSASPDRLSIDADGDGVVDGLDNCPTTYNPDQTDSDGDGIGNVCESGGDEGDECTDCLLCVEIDCDLNGTLLGEGPDYDQNGTVDDDDVYIMMLAWDYPGGRCDLNEDGIVDILDLEILMQDYGQAIE